MDNILILICIISISSIFLNVLSIRTSISNDFKKQISLVLLFLSVIIGGIVLIFYIINHKHIRIALFIQFLYLILIVIWSRLNRLLEK